MTLRPLWTVLIALLAGAAQAQVTISTRELTLTTLLESDFFNMGPQQFSASSTGGVTRIGMTSLATLMNLSVSGDGGGDLYRADFTTLVNPGYRVTGYRFESAVVGTLVAPELPAGVPAFDTPAFLANRADASVSSSATYGGAYFDNVSTTLTSVSGSMPVLLGSADGLNLTGTFVLGVHSSISAAATFAYYTTRFGSQVGLPASASIRFTDPVLTIYTQPVPEPTTWLLMGSGLLVLVAGVRRRNRR